MTAGTLRCWRELPDQKNLKPRIHWRDTWTPRRFRQLWYVPLLLIAMGLMLARVLILARLLDVPAFADLSLGLLISSTFGMLGCLGLQSLLQRDMPILLVHGRPAAAQVLLMQSVAVAYACAAVTGLAVMLKSVPHGPSWISLLGVLHGLSQQVFLLASTESRSRGEPLRFAVESMVRAVAISGLGAGVAALTGSALAVLTTEAVVSLLLAHGLLAWIARQAGRKPGKLMAIGWQRLNRINWRSALTFLIVSMAGFVLVSADRWAASALLDVAGFSQYAFGGTVLVVAMSLQSLVNASVYPMLARLYARSGQRAAFSLTLRLSMGLMLTGLIACVPLYYGLDMAILRWYPAYAGTRELLPIFLIVAVLRLADFWPSFLMITGFETQLLRLNIYTLLTTCSLWSVWFQPWRGDAMTPRSLATLALMLSLAAYCAAATSSWRHHRRKISP
jgi:O-antigen/teichoic acid export membrane protein